MKKLITVLFASLLIGCTHNQRMGVAPIEALTSQLEGKELSKLEISRLPDKQLTHSTNDKKVLAAFQSSLSTCKPMGQIDTVGPHFITVFSNKDEIRFDTDIISFIRIPDWKGQDAYFESSHELIAIFKKIKTKYQITDNE